MTNTVADHWFTEFQREHGLACSLEIKRKCHDEHTPIQHLQVFETTHFGYMLTLDGFIMLTSRDNFIYHEMMVHPALFTHQSPEKVVIIGGGDCGSLKEVLKHPSVTQAWQIDIDKRVTDLSEQYFPELCTSNQDPRAHLLFEDGIAWIKNCAPETLDVIIIDSTDPIGPAEGLFTQAFYADCLKALRVGGIIVQQSESPLLHLEKIIDPMRTAMQDAGATSVNTLLFPLPTYPSGWWSCTMSRKDAMFDCIRESDILKKTFETQYYNLAVHQNASALPNFMVKQWIE